MSRPLLVFALKEESQDVFAGYDILFTGVGKVNAAYALTKRLMTAMPSLVINAGTAGSRVHKAGTIINCTRFMQRDMDATLLGFEKFQTPFSNAPVIIEWGEALSGFTQGLCGSGDNFEASDAALGFDVIDMEAYVLAFICQQEKIPFLCLKYISDGADGEAALDWNEALKQAAHSLLKNLQKAGY